MSRDVFVVGHRGMLGRVVQAYLVDRGHSVATTEARFRGGPGDDLVEAVNRSGAEVVVNCAGAIPSKVSDPDEMLRSNAYLPQQLAARLGSDRLLIHASSDGVYDGATGPYRRDDPPDAIDTYGMSKRLGELAMYLVPTVVIRTSVVGTGGSLLAWLMEQEGEIDGYTNHRWNGITTLEWARVCSDLIDDRRSRRSSIEHVTAQEPVTKCDLLEMAAEVFEVAVRVQPVSSPEPMDRVLIPTIECPPIRKQLEDLRDWERPRS